MKTILGFTVLSGLVLLAACDSSSGVDCPETDFEARREAFFDATLAAPSNTTYSEVMRLARGEAPDESEIPSSGCSIDTQTRSY